MHLFFSGIGGSGIGPLSLLAQQMGHDVSGSDKRDSSFLHSLRARGIDRLSTQQSRQSIASLHQQKPIDWFVYSSAVSIEGGLSLPPEMQFCLDQQIRMSKRDELINRLLVDHRLQLIGVAGTHGKSTTTSMIVWLFKQLKVPISYSIGAEQLDGEMSGHHPHSEYFVYEADEYDRNFLSFHPLLACITGIAFDHPDTYPSRDEYFHAFAQFARQSSSLVVWKSDFHRLEVPADEQEKITVLDDDDAELAALPLVGRVNRRNAHQAVQTVHLLTAIPRPQLTATIRHFPGLARRFERICPRLISDYAHTPEKIRGALDWAAEMHGSRLVVIYEGFQNLRQHLIKDELNRLFDEVEHLHIVPTYLAREDPSLPLLRPADLRRFLSSPTQTKTTASELDEQLRERIAEALQKGSLVLALSAGTTNSLDQWLRTTFAQRKEIPPLSPRH